MRQIFKLKKGTLDVGVMKRAVKWTSTSVDRRPGRKPLEKGRSTSTTRKRQWWTSTNRKRQVEKTSTREKQWSTSTTAFFMVDGRQPFSSCPQMQASAKLFTSQSDGNVIKCNLVIINPLYKRFFWPSNEEHLFDPFIWSIFQSVVTQLHTMNC